MLFLVTGLISACTKEMPENIIIPTTAAQTSLETTEMLSFSSEEEMFKQIEVLKTMQEDELKTWYKQQNENFVSQFDFMWQIVEELDTANSLEEAKEIQSKYTGLMLSTIMKKMRIFHHISRLIITAQSLCATNQVMSL